MPSPFFSTTSRWALRYLLGTSNVSDIDSGFLALASDIDALPLNLLPVASSGASVTAVDGQMLNCTGAAQTVTLPASAKGMLGVRAGGTQTGANPVTVTAAGGALIKGRGHTAGVASIKLGTVGAAVVLLWDGANWFVIAGEQNTGWVAITRGTNVNPGGGYTPAARVAGDMVELCGQLITAVGGVTALGTVPSVAIPASNVGFPNTAVSPDWLIASGTGAITAGTAGGANEPFNLDGLRYRLT